MQSSTLGHNMVVTVGNNINRHDDTAITRGRALKGGDQCTSHYEMELPLY